MPECRHPNVQVQSTHYQIDDADLGVMHSIHTRVWCTTCGMPFRFSGHFPIPPATAVEAIAKNVGAWVCQDASEIGVMIEPMNNPGAGLIGMAPAGSA